MVKQRKVSAEITHGATTEEAQTPPTPLPTEHDAQMDTPDQAKLPARTFRFWFVGTSVGAMLLTHKSDHILHTVTHLLAMSLVPLCNLGSLLRIHVVPALFHTNRARCFQEAHKMLEIHKQHNAKYLLYDVTSPVYAPVQTLPSDSSPEQSMRSDGMCYLPSET